MIPDDKLNPAFVECINPMLSNPPVTCDTPLANSYIARITNKRCPFEHVTYSDIALILDATGPEEYCDLLITCGLDVAADDYKRAWKFDRVHSGNLRMITSERKKLWRLNNYDIPYGPYYYYFLGWFAWRSPNRPTRNM